MAAANNDISQSIALITTANTVAQDPTTVGQGIKTVSLRLRSTKTELEEMGEDAEGAAENVSKLREQMLALTGVDIQLDDDTYKSTYQILLEISKVWGRLSDLSRSSVLEQLFGKRQANIGAAILENGDLLERVYKTSEGSMGSAMREQEEYAKSIQYSIDTLKAAYQDFADSVINSDFVKNLLGTAQSFLEVLTKIIDKFGTLPTILTGIAAIGGFKNIGLFGNLETGLTSVTTRFEALKQVLSYDFGGLYKKFNINFSGISDSEVQSLQNYIDALNRGTKPAEAMKDIMAETSEAAQQQATQFTYLYQSYQRGEISANQYKTATQNLALTQKTATATSKALSIALNTLANVGIMIAINLAIKGVSALVDKLVVTKEELAEIRDEAVSSAEELKANVETFVEETDAIDELVQKYKEIHLSVTDINESKEELIQIQTDLIDKFGGEASGIDLVNGKYEDQIDVIERLSQAKYDEWKRENATAISRAQQVSEFDVQASDNRELINFWGDWADSRLAHQNELQASLYTIKGLSNDIKDIASNIEGVEEFDNILHTDIFLSGRLEEARDQLGQIIDEYSKLDTQSSDTLKALEDHYKALNKEIEDTEFYMSKIRQYESNPAEVVGVIDTPNINKLNALISAMGDARTEWFKALDEMESGFGKTVDSMSSALQKLVDGKNLSNSEFWDLMELDTDKIITDIKMVGDEFVIDQQQLIQLKDQQIQKQIDSLQFENSTLETKKKTLSVAIEQAKAELSILGARGLANEAYRKEYQDAVNSIKQGERNLQDYGDQIRRNNILITQWNSKLGDTADRTEALNKQLKELQDQADAYAKAFTKQIDDVIDGLQKEADALSEEKSGLQEQLDLLEAQRDEIESILDNYKEIASIIEDEVNKEIDAIKEQQKAQEDAYNARIDALKKENEEREDALEYAQKLANLENAKNNKVRVIDATRGFRYESIKEDVVKAENDLADFENNRAIKALEEERDESSKIFDAQIKEYEDYLEYFKEIQDEETKAENERLMAEAFGSDWREKIKKRDTLILQKYQNDFRNYNTQLTNLTNNEIASLKKSIEAKENEIKVKEKQIKSWKTYKSEVETAIKTVNDKYDEYMTKLNDVNLSEGNRETALSNFISTYEGYVSQIQGLQDQIQDTTVGLYIDTNVDEVKDKFLDLFNTADDWANYFKTIRDSDEAADALMEYSIRLTNGMSPKPAPKLAPKSAPKSLYSSITANPITVDVTPKRYGAPPITSTNTATTINNTVNVDKIVTDNPQDFAKQLDRYYQTKLTQSYTNK